MNEINEPGNCKEPPIPIQRACLEIANKMYPIYDGINTIGRDPNAVVNIKNINVSQHHAVIVVIDDNKQYLGDIKSSNGTFLNYNKLQPFSLHQLNDNDLIKFGDLIGIYKRNGVSLEVPQNTLSQAMSQSFYGANTQDVEIVNDFHEMDTQMFDNNPDIDFHDLPTQVQHFDAAQTVDDNVESSTCTEKQKLDATNQELELLCANSTTRDQEIAQNIDDNDTSNDSLVFAEEQLSKLEEQALRETGDDGSIQEGTRNSDLDQQTEQIKPVILVSKCIDSDDDTDIEDNQIEDPDNEDNNQKVTPDIEEETQQIKPLTLTKRSRIDDSDDEDQNVETSKQSTTSDDDIRIEEEKQLQTTSQNTIVNQEIADDSKQETQSHDVYENIENRNESSNESLDLCTMQKVTHNKSDKDFEFTQQIKPLTLTKRSRRIDDSDDEDQTSKQSTTRDDDIHIEEEKQLQKTSQNTIVNQEIADDSKQETQSDDVYENIENRTETIIETAGNHDESSNESLDLGTMQKVTHNKCDFEFTQQIKPVILANTSHTNIQISDSNDDETDIDDDDKNESDIIPATQNVDFVEKQTTQIIDTVEDSFQDSSFALELSNRVFESSNSHQNEDVFNQSTQPLQFNLIETHRNPNKIDEIDGQATQKFENNPETSTEDVNDSKPKDTSSDNDLFALPETPKSQKRSKSNVTRQPLIANVENELQDMFATQQEKFTCSQLVTILADSPTRPIPNKNTTNKTCKAQINLSERLDPIVIDEKVEKELETLFQSQQDLTCSQLVEILDDSKEITNPTTDSSSTKTLKRKLSKMTSDGEIEISESGHIDTNQNKTSAKRSRNRCVTDPQSSLATTSIEENPIDNQENVGDESEHTISPIISSRKNPINAKIGRLSPSKKSSKEGGVVDKSIDNLEQHQDLSSIKCTNTRSARKIENSESVSKGDKENTRELRKRSVSFKKDSQSNSDKSEDNLSVTKSVGKIENNDSSVKEDRRKSKKRSVNTKEDSQSSIESTSSGKTIESDLCKNRRSTRHLRKRSVDSKNDSQSSVQSKSSEDFFDVLKTPNPKKLKDNTSQETERSESSIGSERNLRRVSRKRAAINEDGTKKSTKIRLDENIAKNTRSSVSIDSSSLELKETSSSTIQENNKMSRRTRKNPNNITIPPLLPVRVTVPRKEENCENEQKPSKVPRDRPPKKNTESISTVSDSSSSSTSTINRKTTNIRKGKRRLSANSRSMKNLEKTEEQNDNEHYNETTTKIVTKRRNQQQDETMFDKNNETLSTPERNRRKLKPKVVFTMMDSPELESVIRQLGGTVVDSVDTCTVLVTEHVKRSCKLLSAVGEGKPICSPQWLVDSKKASHFLDPWNYILKDNEAEEKWNFKLHESLERSSRKKLMENYTFQLLVNQAADVLKGAIEACGGKCVTRYSPKNYNANFVIVASPDNRAKYNKIIKQHPAVRVVAPEAIFDGTLRQELQLEKHLL